MMDQPYAGTQHISEFEADQLAHDAEHNIDFVWGAESAQERRNRIAEGFAFAIIARAPYANIEGMAEAATKMADALIAELDK